MSDGKILLFGLSRSTIEIAHRLKLQGFSFVIIDSDTSLVTKAKKLGLDLMIADYSDDDVLVNLGIGEDVAFVFCLFEEDVHNVFLTLAIRSLDPNVQIIATTHTKDAIHKLEIAGATTILDPYQVCGKKIYKLITQPEVMRVIDDTIFGNEDINMEQITITEHSSLNGVLLKDCYQRDRYNMLLLGIHDKEMNKEFIFITEGLNHKLDHGDILVVVGESTEIERFKIDFCL